jgi:hypothetical protein
LGNCIAASDRWLFLFLCSILQEIANVTPINVDDPDQICDLLEQAIKNNSQLKYKEKGYFARNLSAPDEFHSFFFVCLEVVLSTMFSLKMTGEKSCWNST